ncbi:hypothetical protein ANCCAN_24683 [Ancylostoma caninum]|uniref:Phospholipase A2 n=1 Tax=Ancylostoma caninum TaxID=29170 RepID=A0A368FBM7_ANCCA|nr:hypothetical protein ANCCAN_24683 [Ancylostoma caninum]
MQAYLTLLLLAVQSLTAQAWKCGIGPVSSTISYIIALPSDVMGKVAPVYLGIDRCCIEHDALVDGLHLERKEADRIFCECLASKDSW